MAEHDFQINFTVNTSQTEQAREQEKQGYKSVEAVADQSIKNIQRASNEAAAERVQKVQELLTAEQVAAKARENLIAQTNRAAIKAATDELDTVKQAERQKAEAAKQAAESAKKAQKEAADAAKRASKEQAEAAKQAAKEQAEAAREAAASQSALNSGISATVGSLLSVATAAGAITSLGSAVSYVATQFEAANKQAMDAASQAAGFRDKLKEIASLTGRPFADTQTMAREMDIRRQTLQASGDVTALQATAFGLAGSSLGTEPGSKMTPDEFKTALIGAGQLQAIKGIDASAMGGMLGAQVLNSKGTNISGEDIKKQMYSLFKVADAGGMSPKQFADSFGQLAPMVKSGDIGSLTDLAGLMSTMSLSDPGTVTTRVQQLQRLTKGSINDVSKPAGAKMSPSEYLKGLGATDQMDMSAILGMMGKDVEAKSAEARKSGKTLSMDTYLRERGYGSIEDINAFKAFSANKDKSDKFTEMAKATISAEEIQQQVRGFAFSPQGFSARASLAEDQSRIGQGVGVGEYAQAYKRDLFARLKQRDESKPVFGWKGQYEDATSGMTGSMFFKEELAQDLIKKVTATGLTEESFGSGMNNPFARLRGAASGSREESSIITEILTRVGQAGGQMLGSGESDKILQQQLQSSMNIEKIMTDIANKLPAQPALNAVPGGANAGRMP